MDRRFCYIFRLLAVLLEVMERKGSDFTQSFRDLSEISIEDLKTGQVPESAWGLKRMVKDKQFKKFVELYVHRLEEFSTNDEERMALMQRSNPRYILRNWLAQRAIEMAENGDFSEVQRLLRVLKDPYRVQVEAERQGYAKPPPGWSRLIKVSCSS